MHQGSAGRETGAPSYSRRDYGPDGRIFNYSRGGPSAQELGRLHAERGEKILRTISGEDAALVADAIRHHHEEFDGSGYPDSLAGENIPLLSRIISIVDNYGAMSSQRVYHVPRQHDHIIGVMQDESGGKHDPYLLGRFMDVIERSPLRAS